jgi:hypothetical protein
MGEAHYVRRDENNQLVVAALNILVRGGLQAGDFAETG